MRAIWSTDIGEECSCCGSLQNAPELHPSRGSIKWYSEHVRILCLPLSYVSIRWCCMPLFCYTYISSWLGILLQHSVERSPHRRYRTTCTTANCTDRGILLSFPQRPLLTTSARYPSRNSFWTGVVVDECVRVRVGFSLLSPDSLPFAAGRLAGIDCAEGLGIRSGA